MAEKGSWVLATPRSRRYLYASVNVIRCVAGSGVRNQLRDAGVAVARKIPKIESFNFPAGRVLAGKYLVERFLGSGWEGEVYGVVETSTGILRALKVFYPHRNERDRALRFYARKLERLRDCRILTRYHHAESLWFRGIKVACLVSELVDGELLSSFLSRHPGKRLPPFEGLHLAYALACGLECIHRAREYHGDVHDENVLVRRRGIHFDVKLVDFYHLGPSDRSKIQEDVIQLVRLLYDAVGGRRRYALQPPAIKTICCGLRRDLITRKFPDAGRLRAFLETFPWERSD